MDLGTIDDTYNPDDYAHIRNANYRDPLGTVATEEQRQKVDTLKRQMRVIDRLIFVRDMSWGFLIGSAVCFAVWGAWLWIHENMRTWAS